ncbi:MAG TPA: SAM-dependent methyltransferase [Gammaproteobacteria bacterium]
MNDSRLPPPDPAALERSRTLAALIRDEIAAEGGWIGFDRYMERALYAPGLGYYSAGAAKLGRGGDFVTAPELSDALGRAIAAALGPLLAAMAEPVILELGAGTGRLAAQILDALERRGSGPVAYRILETSAELRSRQQRLLAGRPGVAWLDRLPEQPFDGLIVANEVADALPVACFVKRRGRIVPVGVSAPNGALGWAEGPEQPALTEAVGALEVRLGAPLPEHYRSEIRPVLPPWITALGGTLRRGAMLLVDYGYTRREYYDPARSRGTLICHYRHRALDDPFVYPGLQDITAWVDFSACADAARAAGLEVAGYTTQAQLLIGALGADLLPADAGPAELAALKTLVLPGEMGERFKALLLGKGLDGAGLPGRDFRSRL